MDFHCKYDLVFKGEIIDGHDLTRVKAGIAKMFKTDAARVEPMFSGTPMVVKKGLDSATAGKIREAFEKAGAILHCVALEEPLSPKSPPSPVPEPRKPAPDRLVASPSPAPIPDDSSDPYERYQAEKTHGLPKCPGCMYQPKDSGDNLYVRHNGKGECPSCGIIVENFLKKKQKEYRERLAAEGQKAKPADPALEIKGELKIEGAEKGVPSSGSKFDSLLEEAKTLISEDKWMKARSVLESAMKMDDRNWEVHYLLAKSHSDEACIDVEPDEEAETRTADSPSPEKVLFYARNSFELGGDKNPDVLLLYGESLGKTGKIEEGLEMLENGAGLEQEKKLNWSKIIEDYRKKHTLGNLWQFFDPKGRPIFESVDVELIRRKLLDGSLPLYATCKKNRIGEPGPLKETIAKEENRIKILFHPILYHAEMGAMILGGIVGGIGALIGGIWYITQVFHYAKEDFHKLFENIIVTIAALFFFWWLFLGLFLVILCLVAAVGGLAGGIPGGAVGAAIGLLVGLVRAPFLPKLPKQGSGKA